MVQRKKWLIIFVISTLSFIGFIYYLVADHGNGLKGNIINSDSSEETTLPIPKVLEDQNPDPEIAEFHLIAKKGMKGIP